MALLFLAAAHFLVDVFATLVSPLWPRLAVDLDLSRAAEAMAFACWSLSTSISQFLFACYGDRRQGKWLVLAGPALAVSCLSLIGLTGSIVTFLPLLIVGGVGVAAFHPEGAALAGACLPEHRSRAVSIFAVGGFVGTSLGPVYSGYVCTHFGIERLAWSIPVGLMALLLLAIGLKRIGTLARSTSSIPSAGFRQVLKGKGRSVLILVVAGILRVLTGAGVPLALSQWLFRNGFAEDDIGVAQSIFLGGFSIGAICCSIVVDRRKERFVMTALPVIMAPFLLIAPQLSFGLLLPILGVAGWMFGLVQPVMISYGQQLLPNGQRVASSLTMGVTWGIGGGVVAALMWICNNSGHPEWAFYTFGLSSIGSSVLVNFLPSIAAADQEPGAAPVSQWEPGYQTTATGPR